MTAKPRVELLWWPGCPSHERALADLRDAVGELGLSPDAVELVRIDTEQDAARERFAGSPTIRVDGADLLPPGADEPIGLTCRLYRLRDGRASPTPDPADLREALVATMREEVTDA
ncbi:MAG: DF family (seleno)protein [Solirubrobacterales bacterium]